MATASAIYGTAIYGSSEYGVVNLSVAIAGVAATGAVNTLTLTGDATQGLIGVTATATVNIPTLNVLENISSVSASSTVNGNGISVGINIPIVATDVVATGTISPVAAVGFEIDLTEPLGSVQAITSLGSIQVNLSKLLSVFQLQVL